MDIRYFALSDWVEQDLMFLERIHTSINEADHFTKILERTLFYRHVDHIMGHIPPAYSPCYQTITGNKQAEADPIQKDELVHRLPGQHDAKFLWIFGATSVHMRVQWCTPIWCTPTLECGGVLVDSRYKRY